MSPTPHQIAQAAALNKEWARGLQIVAKACFKSSNAGTRSWGGMLRKLAEHLDQSGKVLDGEAADIDLRVIAMQYGCEVAQPK